MKKIILIATLFTFAITTGILALPQAFWPPKSQATTTAIGAPFPSSKYVGYITSTKKLTVYIKCNTNAMPSGSGLNAIVRYTTNTVWGDYINTWWPTSGASLTVGTNYLYCTTNTISPAADSTAVCYFRFYGWDGTANFRITCTNTNAVVQTGDNNGENLFGIRYDGTAGGDFTIVPDWNEYLK